MVRLRRLSEGNAQRAFAEGQSALDACRTRIAAVEDDVIAQRGFTPVDVDDLTRTHAHLLRQEMLRRRLVTQAQRVEGEVERRRDALVVARKSTKVAEKLAEAAERREREAAEARLAKELDEIGQIGWSRGRAA